MHSCAVLRSPPRRRGIPASYDVSCDAGTRVTEPTVPNTPVDDVNQTAKPVPVPDQVSEGFWAWASRHVLSVQRCDWCGRLALPPVILCPGCLSTQPRFSFTPTSGGGRLRTWTVMRDAFLPGFRADIPWVIGEVELDDAAGVRLLARLDEKAETELHIDVRVVVAFEDVSSGISLPVIRLATA